MFRRRTNLIRTRNNSFHQYVKFSHTKLASRPLPGHEHLYHNAISRLNNKKIIKLIWRRLQYKSVSGQIISTLTCVNNNAPKHSCTGDYKFIVIISIDCMFCLYSRIINIPINIINIVKYSLWLSAINLKYLISRDSNFQHSRESERLWTVCSYRHRFGRNVNIIIAQQEITSSSSSNRTHANDHIGAVFHHPALLGSDVLDTPMLVGLSFVGTSDDIRVLLESDETFLETEAIIAEYFVHNPIVVECPFLSRVSSVRHQSNVLSIICNQSSAARRQALRNYIKWRALVLFLINSDTT